MSGTRIGFEGTYTSGTSTNQYRYTIVADLSGVLSVRDIRTPKGFVVDTMTRLPRSVVDDINDSMSQVEGLLSMTSSVNGTATFSAQTEVSVTFSTAMSSTDYRVHLSPSDFIPVQISSKLTTGFTIRCGVTFTGTVDYDVFV